MLSSERAATDELRPSGQRFLVAVSMKSKSFSNAWIKGVLSDIEQVGGRAELTLVDAPYFHNLELAGDNLEVRRKELQKLSALRKQTEVRLRRICDQSPLVASFQSWDMFQLELDNSNSWMKDEFLNAFWRKGLVYGHIIRAVRRNFNRSLSDSLAERLAKFLIEELPVLFHIYYVSRPGWIDVYPGDHAEVVWEVERGKLLDELPQLSQMAATSEPLRYAEVHLRSSDR
jgi:hypothetical protein